MVFLILFFSIHRDNLCFIKKKFYVWKNATSILKKQHKMIDGIYEMKENTYRVFFVKNIILNILHSHFLKLYITDLFKKN